MTHSRHGNDPAYVYITVGSPSPMALSVNKIGSSYSPEQRSKNVYIGDILFIVRCDNRKAAFKLEYELHRHFADKRIYKEWFRLDASDLSYILAECGYENSEDEYIDGGAFDHFPGA